LEVSEELGVLKDGDDPAANAGDANKQGAPMAGLDLAKLTERIEDIAARLESA
jgi:hypothetical protein